MTDLITSALLIETIKAIALVALFLVWIRSPKYADRAFRQLEQYCRALAARPALATLAAGLIPVMLRLVLLPLNPVPEPRIHDEFGHLLLADTFASGRITNPQHPHWTSFESIYILSTPTYTSQYQPAIGLFLAAGQLVVGHPWAGVVASMGLLCAALYWMLRGWVASEWALLGSVLIGLHIGVFSYWINSYWGGAVPALGGALVLGALPRLLNARWRVAYSVVAALGLAVVMNSRPVEALLLGLVAGGYVIWRVCAREMAMWSAVLQIAIPIALLLAATLSAMAYYNWRVTGDPLEPPYVLHLKTYGTPQPFWWQKPVPAPAFRHQELKDEYLRQRMLHDRRSSPFAIIRSAGGRSLAFVIFFLGVPLVAPFLFLRSAWRESGVQFALAAGLPFALDHLTFHAFYPHYAAPAMGLLLIVLVHCWRHMLRWEWRGRHTGLVLSRALPVVLAFGLLVPVVGKLVEPVLPAEAEPVKKIWAELYNSVPPRIAMQRDLERAGGRHLVFVRYRHPGHNPDNEWVYNRANIDSSTVVWARDLDRSSNLSLIQYYGSRKAWVVEPDVNPPLLYSYGGTPRR